MSCRNILALILLSLTMAGLSNNLPAQDDLQANASDWARWRGPNGNGIATADQKPPVKWSSTENVVWKTKIPGKGHSSPIVMESQIFLTTANVSAGTQSVVCIKRKDGELLWQTEISRGKLPKIHPKNTHASPTVATDGKHIFCVFKHDGFTELSKLDFEGNIVWKKKVGQHESGYNFGNGYGASPIVYGDNVIVSNENEIKSSIVAFNKKSGEESWRIDRTGVSSYSTPVVAEVGGKKQLLQSGGKLVKSYDPKDGSENWSIDAAWVVSCGTLIWDGDMVFASGGFPAQQTLAIDTSKGPAVAWENPTKVYEQSMLIVDGYIFAHAENNAVYCWRAADGKEMWKKRFSKRKHGQSVSPVLAGGNIYFTAENGETVVIKPNSKQFEEVARNKLGDLAFATPAFCDNRIYARVGDSTTGKDHQWLYCLGEK